MKTKMILTAIIFLHAFLLTRLIFFPYPELFVYPFLANNGLLPYKQIFDQHFPSIMMLPFNLSDIGLQTPESARLFLIGLIVINHLTIYLIAKNLFKKERPAILANLLYFLIQPLFEGYALWLDSFLVPILLFSFYFSWKFLKEKRNIYALLVGLLLGLAFFVKQATLPLLIVASGYLIYKSKSPKGAALLLIGGFLPISAVVFWIYRQGILKEFFYWTVTFNFEVYAKLGRKLPTFSQAVRTLAFFSPALFLTFSKALKEKRVLLLGIFLVLSLFLSLTRFEFVHLQPVLPFVALLTADFFSRKRVLLKHFFVVVIIVSLILWLPVFYKGHLGNGVYFFDSDTVSTAKKVREQTTPNEPIFVLGSQPVIYSISQRLPAGRVFMVNVFWNMEVAQDKILDGLERDIPKVVVRDASSIIDGKKVIDFSQKINSFIEERYIKIDQIGDNEILIPKK